MGFFNKMKRKERTESHKKHSNKREWTTPSSAVPAATFSSASSSHQSQPQETLQTNILQTSLLHNVTIVATDTIEVLTAESQQAILRQREAIRQQLFAPTTSKTTYPSNNDPPTTSLDTSTATDTSHEILANGRVVPNDRLTNRSMDAMVHQEHGAVQLDVRRGMRSRTVEDNVVPAQRSASSSDTRRAAAVVTPNGSKEEEQPVVVAGRSARRYRSPFAVKQEASESSSRPMDERLLDAAVGGALLVSSSDGRSPRYQNDLEDPVVVEESTATNKADQLIQQRAQRRTMDNSSKVDTTASSSDIVDSPRRSRSSRPAMRRVSFSESEDDDDTTTERGDTSSVVEEDTSTFVSSMYNSSSKTTTATSRVAAAVSQCGDHVLHCGTTTTTIDNHHDTHHDGTPLVHRERPVYLSSSATQKFLRRITRSGFVVLYLLADEEGTTWAGRTVTMAIAPSAARLEWTTVAGGQRSGTATLAVDLLAILAIDTEVMEDDNDDKKKDAAATTTCECIFTITTDTGAVHIFEATSMEERDRIVHGLRTLLARWAFQLVAGDTTATSELYNTNNGRVAGQLLLPPPQNPEDTMNRIAHQLLDG